MSEKRTLTTNEKDQRKKARPTVPFCGARPIVEMMLDCGNKDNCQVRVLLDTGCSTTLISNQLVEKLSLSCVEYKQEIAIRNFTGELVPEAGQRYTSAVMLQHRQHYTREVFEVAPLEAEVDIFLPCWWIARHPPQGAWDTAELRFNTPSCVEHCTKLTTTKFSLSLDPSILSRPDACVIGYVSAVMENPLEQVPREFQQFLDIMGTEAADALPEHSPYDHEIRLKEGEKPPWGPIYPLSEAELEAL